MSGHTSGMAPGTSRPLPHPRCWATSSCVLLPCRPLCPLPSAVCCCPLPPTALSVHTGWAVAAATTAAASLVPRVRAGSRARPTCRHREPRGCGRRSLNQRESMSVCPAGSHKPRRQPQGRATQNGAGPPTGPPSLGHQLPASQAFPWALSATRARPNLAPQPCEHLDWLAALPPSPAAGRCTPAWGPRRRVGAPGLPSSLCQVPGQR